MAVLPPMRSSASAGSLPAVGNGSRKGTIVKVSSSPTLPGLAVAESKKVEDNLIKLRFLGNHGLSWEGTRVSNAVLQAWMLGVRPGWTIRAVAGREVQTSAEIEEQLQQSAGSERRYEVCFTKGRGRFGTEAKERADKEKRYLTKLRMTFTFKANIQRPEHRGITCRQLEQLLEFVQDHCHTWEDKAPAKLSKTAGQQLHMGILNFYHIDHWVIQPATKAKRCAFVELMATKGQPPLWFVTHWWGDRIASLVQCVRAHAATRPCETGSSYDAPYWVGAFAIRQHAQEELLADDLTKSGLYKALEASRFSLLLVLTDPAVALGRLWCAFEASLCLEQPAALLDVSVCTGFSCEVMTRGLTENEEQMELQRPGSGIQAKATREATFPLKAMADSLLAIDVRRAQTTLEDDRVLLLNGLTGRPLRSPLSDDRGPLTEISTRLRAFFAAPLWLGASWTSDSGNELLTRCSQALRSDQRCRALHLHLEGLGDQQLLQLAEGLPQQLQELRLWLRCASIQDDELVTLSKVLPPGLKYVWLDLEHCRNITDGGVQALVDNVSSREVAIDLSLGGTQVSTEVQEHYTAVALKREEEQKYGHSKLIERALGVALCRDPDRIKKCRQRVVPAVRELERALVQNDPNRSQVALKALGAFGDRALQGLGDDAAQRAREIEAELEVKEAERLGKKAEKAS